MPNSKNLVSIAGQRLLTCALISGWLLLPGCGGDEAASTPQSDAAVLDAAGEAAPEDAGVDADALVDSEASVDSNAEADAEAGSDADAQPALFEVVSTLPTDQQTDVDIDTSVRVTFSAAVDATTPSSAFLIEDSTGFSPNGTWRVESQSAVFSPALLRPNETYTITIASSVGDGTATLQGDYSFQFTTGATTSHGTPPPAAEDSPLGPGVTTIAKRPEYAITWTTEKSVTVPNGYLTAPNDLVIHDPQEDPTSGSAANLFEDDWVMNDGSEKIPISGQFDNDGWDEVMVVEHFGSDLTAYLFDTTAANTVIPALLPLDLEPSTGAGIDGFAAVAADFDGDGRDELAVVMRSTVEKLHYRLIDYNPSNDSYEISLEGTVDTVPLLTAYDLLISAGDIDADGLPEVVVLNHGTNNSASFAVVLTTFDDAKAGFTQLFDDEAVLLHYDPGLRCPYPVPSLTTGDVDGDGADEIFVGSTVFLYMTSSLAGHQCRTEDRLYYLDNFTEGNVAAKPLAGGTSVELNDLGPAWYPNDWMGNDRTMRRPMGLLLAGRFSGDPVREEVLFHNRIYAFNSQLSVTDDALTPKTVGWPIQVPATIYDHTPSSPYYQTEDLSLDYLTRDAQVADMDGDQKDDVVLLRKSTARSDADGHESGFKIKYFDLDVPSGGSTPVFDAHTEELASGSTYQSWNGSPRLALPNIDDDSAILELTDHASVLSDNILVAVLSVPPWKDNIGQKVSSCSTGFGEGTGVTVTNSASVNADMGVTLGLSWQPSVTISAVVVGLKLTLAKVDAAMSAGVKTSYKHSWGTTVKETMSYKTGPYENLVIVDNYVYESYLYTIIQHPDPAKIGEIVTVNVPLDRRRSALSQAYYNAHNGNDIDIDDSIMPSVPGDISSYVSLGDAMIILGEPNHEPIVEPDAQSYLLEPPASTGASATWGYGITHSDSNAFSVGLYVKASLKACTPNVGGWTPTVCGGVTAGGSTSYSYSHKFSETMSLSGSVGSIPSANWLDDVYRTGLFAYRVTVEPDPEGTPAGPGLPVPGRQQFIVVNYYIQ